MKTIVKILVAALVGFAAMCVAIAFDASDKVAIVSYFGVAIAIALALGAFDSADKSASEEGRVKSEKFASAVKKNYRQAAVFVGTACLFIGTQTECDERADDLWHYGQQAHVQQLTGEETQFDVL